jgi:AraC family transcriptional regulator of adaptative response/methylated-DNA-[protein]-cysteine methyltransferase
MQDRHFNHPETQCRAYQTIVQAIGFLIERQPQQPTLSALAEHLQLSEFHLQRLFSDWAGLTPKQFLQYLTRQHARHCLREMSVFDAAIESGLSGPSRLHDLMLRCDSVTPGELRSRGRGLRIWYGCHPTPFGPALLALTERGICKLGFYDSPAQQLRLLHELEQDWQAAERIDAPERTAPLIRQIFDPALRNPQPTIRALLRGTPFQIQVWEALLQIPPGRLCDYRTLAGMIGKPTATRAVASAIARNRIGLLIPCHRVIRSSGILGDYRWGEPRKAALIGIEAARRASSDPAQDTVQGNAD